MINKLDINMKKKILNIYKLKGPTILCQSMYVHLTTHQLPTQLTREKQIAKDNIQTQLLTKRKKKKHMTSNFIQQLKFYFRSTWRLLTDIIADSFTRLRMSAPEKPTVRKTSCRMNGKHVN